LYFATFGFTYLIMVGPMKGSIFLKSYTPKVLKLSKIDLGSSSTAIRKIKVIHYV
jgi:hypothetical protein